MSTDFRGLDSKGLPLVSIVAVSYKHERFLEETLESIKDQTYSNIQLIIMDDCSQDRSVQKIEAWIEKNNVNCQFIAHKENAGICKTLNVALRYSTGKYFQGISCDDVMLPEKIYKQVELLEKSDEQVAMVYTNAYIIDEEGKRKENMFIERYRKFEKYPSGYIFNDLIRGNFIPAMSILIKKEVFDRIGVYDEDLDFEDYDLWLRMAKEFKISFINKPLAEYRLHNNNLHKKILFHENYFKILIKHVDQAKIIVQPILLNALLSSYRKRDSNLRSFSKLYYQKYDSPFLLNVFLRLDLKYFIYHYMNKMVNMFK